VRFSEPLAYNGTIGDTMFKKRPITASYISILVAIFLAVRTAMAGDDGVSIPIRRQTREEWLAVGETMPIKPLTFDAEAQKKLAATLAVSDLKSLTDNSLRGHRLTSVLPLGKIKSIYVPYPSLDQEITRTMTDSEVIRVLEDAKVLAADDMKHWHFAPGGRLTLTTVNGVDIHVGLLLGGRGSIQIAGKSIYFEYDLASKNKGDTTPSK
jgi:hypothetical protein